MKNEVTIAFTGDISFTKYFGIDRRIAQYTDECIAGFLRSSDHVVGNVEGAILSRYDNSKKPEFKHFSDSECVRILKDLGIDIWSLANNHIFDYGEDGVNQTLEIAEQNHCNCIGLHSDDNAHTVYRTEECGGICILSLSYDERECGRYKYLKWNDFDHIRKIVKEFKMQNRWCIAVVHAGDEFSPLPMPQTRDTYLEYLDMGIDIVIGHHPHVVENYEVVGDKIIFYSLGNFIFDTDYQRIQNGTDVGVLLKLHITESRFTWDAVGLYIDRSNSIVKKDILPAAFADLSEEQYKRLWLYAARELNNANKRIDDYLHPRTNYKRKILLFAKRLKRCITSKKEREYHTAILASFLPHYLSKNDRLLKASIIHRG